MTNHGRTIATTPPSSDAQATCAQTLLERGDGLEAFEQVIGPLEKVEAEWHEHIRSLKARLAGTDLPIRRSQVAPTTP